MGGVDAQHKACWASAQDVRSVRTTLYVVMSDND